MARRSVRHCKECPFCLETPGRFYICKIRPWKLGRSITSYQFGNSPKWCPLGHYLMKLNPPPKARD